MSSTISGFNFVELTTSMHGTIGDQSQEVIREFLIPWNSLGGFVQSLRGGWSRVNANMWAYRVPDQCSYAGFANFFCQEVTFETYGQATWDPASQLSSWDQVKVNATYRIPKFDPANPNDILEESLDFSVEELTLPSDVMKDDYGNTIDQPLRVLLPICDYTLTLHNVPSLPGGSAMTIMGLLGLVNQSSFKGADPGKMLFMGAKTDRTVTSQGSKGWTIAYKFVYRPIKWTQVYVNNGGNLALSEPVDGAGKKLYEGGTFDSLFT